MPGRRWQRRRSPACWSPMTGAALEMAARVRCRGVPAASPHLPPPPTHQHHRVPLLLSSPARQAQLSSLPPTQQRLASSSSSFLSARFHPPRRCRYLCRPTLPPRTPRAPQHHARKRSLPLVRMPPRPQRPPPLLHLLHRVTTEQRRLHWTH